MKIRRTYKTEMDLNNRQKMVCFQHAGTVHIAYNGSLARKQEAYIKAKKAPSTIDLHRQLIAPNRPIFPRCTMFPYTLRKKPCATSIKPLLTTFAG
jgi:hypothetical protein